MIDAAAREQAPAVTVATAVKTATAAVCDPGLTAEANAQFGSSFETRETWDGVATSVDAAKPTSGARLAAVEGDSARQRAELELNEVNSYERDRIRPGGVFRWELDALDVCGKRVRSSKVGFRPLPSRSDRDLASGRPGAPPGPRSPDYQRVRVPVLFIGEGRSSPWRGSRRPGGPSPP